MLLLETARAAGVDVHQPCTVTGMQRDGGLHHCTTRSTAAASQRFAARIVIAAHGSWDAGTLPTQPSRPPAPTDLLGFKAHFSNSALPADLMPLLAFPGGYGGTVHCDGGRISLSCCIRRDRLERIRSQCAGDAGDAVQAHIAAVCVGAAQALAGARRDGPWLAAGPIRPGIRLQCRDGIFPVGNAAGEAHPVIAEGISIALQSAWLLARYLIAWRNAARTPRPWPWQAHVTIGPGDSALPNAFAPHRSLRTGQCARPRSWRYCRCCAASRRSFNGAPGLAARQRWWCPRPRDEPSRKR